ncbi:hypothetical protein NTE_01985 [Candidatus Nitrososphaera evergladensis SR1]|uniref:Uncharacterized protein n=1 Tax=Candidatus Nitrososphaera evergladensis SR1 TaxID=1459636 RepID=A0A075MSA7_9ARCH|nr:hypothetical protein [Candidatus Nitrososphaera evergladensis]AIF84043.1 hypothetical protein NTE_01985 [Candidatus Nitrososphaera evergladensis SR1]
MNLTRGLAAKSLLFAAVLSVTTSVLATTASAVMTTTTLSLLPAAFAQQQTTTGNSTLSGIIASTQISNAGAPLWLSAGSWKLVTDKPIFGGNNQTQPTVKSFDATVDMVLLSNGTMFHTHHIYNFVQSGVLFQGNNVTAINGTMSVTTEKGTTENVPGYLHFQNNIMSIWVNPGKIDNHFGPTPINGMILSPEKLEELGAHLPQIQQNTTGSAQSNMTR